MKDRRKSEKPDRRSDPLRLHTGRRAADARLAAAALVRNADMELATSRTFVDVIIVALALNVSCETVRAWIRGGKLDAIRTPGGHYRIPRDAFQKIKTQTTQEPQTAPE